MHNNFSDVKIIFKFVCIKEKKAKSLSHVQLFAIPWTVAYQTPPARGFFWQEYWSGLPFPPPGDLPNSGIEPRYPTWQADALQSEPQGVRKWYNILLNIKVEN